MGYSGSRVEAAGYRCAGTVPGRVGYGKGHEWRSVLDLDTFPFDASADGLAVGVTPEFEKPKSLEQGVSTILRAALDPSLAGKSRR